MLLDVCKVTERLVTNISRMIKCLKYKKKNLSVWVPSFLTAKSWAYTNTSFSLPYPSFNPSSLLSVLKIKSPLGRKLRESFYSLSEKMATHSNILAWKIPWIEEPGGLTVPRATKSQTRLSDFAFLLLLLLVNIQLSGRRQLLRGMYEWAGKK